MRIGTQGIVGDWLVILFSFDKMASVGCQTTWQSFDPVFGLATPPSPPTPSVTKSPFWRKGRPTAMFAHGSAPLRRTAVCLTGQPRALGGILGKDVLLIPAYASEKHRHLATRVRDMLYNVSLSSASPSTFISDMYKTNIFAPLSRSGGYDLFVIIPGNGSSAMIYEKLRPRTSNPNGKPDRMFTRLGGPERGLPYVSTDARWHSYNYTYRRQKTAHPGIQSALYQLRDLEACNAMINDVVVAGDSTYAYKMRLRTDLIFAAPIPPPHLLNLGTNDFPVISIGSPTFLKSNFDKFGIGHSHIMDCWFNGFSMVHNTSLLDENGTWTIESYLMSRCKRAFNNITFRAESRIQPLLLRHNLSLYYELRLASCPVFDQGEVPSPVVQDSNMLSMSRSCKSCEPAHTSSCTGTHPKPASTLAEVCHLYCCRYYLSSSLQVPTLSSGGADVLLDAHPIPIKPGGGGAALDHFPGTLSSTPADVKLTGWRTRRRAQRFRAPKEDTRVQTTLEHLFSNARSTRARGVIVYLTQVKHSSYGRDSLAELRQSLESLVNNYLRRHRDETLLLHTGKFNSPQLQELVLSPFSDEQPQLPISFMRLESRYLSLPPWVNATAERSPPCFSPTTETCLSTWRMYPKFSIGYRSMIRFLTIKLWDFASELGYEWVMRMDEESRLASPIHYHIFTQLQAEGVEYGYRQVSYESGMKDLGGEVFHRFLGSYLEKRPLLKPKWLLDSCERLLVDDGSPTRPTYSELLSNFSLQLCGPLYGFSNNFFVTRLSFWMRRDVQDWLGHIDQGSLIYTHRINDIMWHSSALQMFLNTSQVKLLDDFTYEHATRMYPKSLRPNTNTTTGAATSNERGDLSCVIFGGRSSGSLDTVQSTMDFLDQICPFSQPCVQSWRDKSTGRQMLSVTVGGVVVEQPDCAQQPSNYLCNHGLRRSVTRNVPFQTDNWKHPFNMPDHEGYMRLHKCSSKVALRLSSRNTLELRSNSTLRWSWNNTLHGRLTGSPPRIPKGPDRKGAGSFPAGPCQPRQVCVGLSTCEWPEATYVPFKSGWHTSTLWGRGTPVAVNTKEICPSCGCRDATRHTLLTCKTTLIVNRAADSGFGSLVNTAVAQAVGALGTGHGFQMSDMVCAIEDRGKPHCFYQPASNCGSSILMVDGWNHHHCAHEWFRLSNDRLILERACYRAAEVLGRNSSLSLCASGTSLEKWRIVAKLILRVQPDIEARIHREYLADLAWSRDAYAAVHIRRTDKYLEARPLATCAYADRLASMCRGRCGGLDVFVATDDIKVVSEFARCNASILHSWTTHSLEGSPPRNWGRASVYRLYAELILIMRSEWAVATFSSNVGRLVQLMRDQPEDTMASLDAQWSAGPYG